MPRKIKIVKYVGEVRCVEQHPADPQRWLVYFKACGEQIEGMVEVFSVSLDMPYHPGDPIGIVIGSKEVNKILLPGTKEYAKQENQIFGSSEIDLGALTKVRE